LLTGLDKIPLFETGTEYTAEDGFAHIGERLDMGVQLLVLLAGEGWSGVADRPHALKWRWQIYVLERGGDTPYPHQQAGAKMPSPPNARVKEGVSSLHANNL